MDASILAWFQIANMVSSLPTEHKIQTAEYKEQMLCLREKRCYSFLDTRDNTWVIRKKESMATPPSENSKCLTPTQPPLSLDCEEQQKATEENQK